MECKFGQLDFVSSDLRLRGDIFIPKLLTNRASVTMVSLAIIMLPFLAVAQTTYHDPTQSITATVMVERALDPCCLKC
jgi:hypothetical protein